MTPDIALGTISVARGLIDLATRWAALAEAEGNLTPEQLATIRERAELSDDRWDTAVAEARAELEARR